MNEKSDKKENTNKDYSARKKCSAEAPDWKLRAVRIAQNYIIVISITFLV